MLQQQYLSLYLAKSGQILYVIHMYGILWNKTVDAKYYCSYDSSDYLLPPYVALRPRSNGMYLYLIMC